MLHCYGGFPHDLYFHLQEQIADLSNWRARMRLQEEHVILARNLAWDYHLHVGSFASFEELAKFSKRIEFILEQGWVIMEQA